MLVMIFGFLTYQVSTKRPMYEEAILACSCLPAAAKQLYTVSFCQLSVATGRSFHVLLQQENFQVAAGKSPAKSKWHPLLGRRLQGW
jgi:hypothetical protein